MRNMESRKLNRPAIGRIIFVPAAFFFLVVFAGCSSAPKRPAETFTARNIAVSQLNMADQAANQGRYEEALILLEEARRLALATDDPSLRIKTSISKANYLFPLGRQDEAFGEWENAAKEADASSEQVLAALARIYTIRARLMLLDQKSSSGGVSGGGTDVETFKSQLNQEIAAVKADSFATAAGYVTLGIAERQMKRWPDAENAVKMALGIHEKGLYLEDAAYDWFLIASVRSLAGNYNDSLDALNAAIGFDRRAENGFGLASSWQAMGDVYKKAGRAEESRSAYTRAAEIFRAIGLNEKAEKLEE